MDSTRRKRLEALGWRVGTAGEFLHLSPQEISYIELRLNLAAGLRRRRLQQKLSQVELARLIHSSQSRVAKMEAGDPSVSLDLLMQALIALGASKRDLADVIQAA